MHLPSMKPLLGLISLMLLVLLLFGIATWHRHNEKPECICAILNEDDATAPFDSRLASIIDIRTLTPGTFMRVNTHCKHNVHLWITIHVDQGYYNVAEIH